MCVEVGGGLGLGYRVGWGEDRQFELDIKLCLLKFVMTYGFEVQLFF